MDAKDEELRLIKYLLSKSYYKNKLAIDITLLEIIQYNNQLRYTLKKLLTLSNFSSSSQIDKRKFHNEIMIFENFFEYLFYASHSFVRKAAYGN